MDAETTSGDAEITVSELREKLPELLARVALLNTSYTIVKHGKKFAVLRPIQGGGSTKDNQAGDNSRGASRGGTCKAAARAGSKAHDGRPGARRAL